MPASTSLPRGQPVVFTDRDGTLIEDVGYLSRAEQIRFLPGAAAALKQLNEARIAVIVVSNQSGVARGLIDSAFAASGGDLLNEQLARKGARIDAYYHCPHLPSQKPGCECRKPAPGMLLRAAREHGAALSGSFMIGDKRGDLETGADLGVIPLLVRTGYGRDAERDLPPDFERRGGRVFDDFPAAARWILSRAPAP